MSKYERWAIGATLVLVCFLTITGLLVGCSNPTQCHEDTRPIEVVVQVPPDTVLVVVQMPVDRPDTLILQVPQDGPDTVRVTDLMGFWKWKVLQRASMTSPYEPRWAQFQFKEDGQYEYMGWEAGAPALLPVYKSYGEEGLWQLTPPNRLYLTITSTTNAKARDLPRFYPLLRDGNYMWFGGELWERGKW